MVAPCFSCTMWLAVPFVFFFVGCAGGEKKIRKSAYGGTRAKAKGAGRRKAGALCSPNLLVTWAGFSVLGDSHPPTSPGATVPGSPKVSMPNRPRLWESFAKQRKQNLSLGGRCLSPRRERGAGPGGRRLGRVAGGQPYSVWYQAQCAEHNYSINICGRINYSFLCILYCSEQPCGYYLVKINKIIDF